MEWRTSSTFQGMLSRHIQVPRGPGTSQLSAVSAVERDPASASPAPATPGLAGVALLMGRPVDAPAQPGLVPVDLGRICLSCRHTQVQVQVPSQARVSPCSVLMNLSMWSLMMTGLSTNSLPYLASSLSLVSEVCWEAFTAILSCSSRSLGMLLPGQG